MTLREPDAAGRLRQTSRLVVMGAWTAFCYLAWLPVAILALVSGTWSRRWNELTVKVWTGGLVAAIGIKVDVVGTPPPKPFFMVANHLSYLDILVLGSRLGPTFISKHELASWPVLGHLARVTGVIFVNRDRKRDAVRVLEEIGTAVARGAGVVLFPEGTSTKGDQIYPLKTALLEWAARNRYPVHAVSLRYAASDPGWSAVDDICWWGDAAFAPHFLNLLTIPQVTATLSFAPDPVIEGDRTLLGTRLRSTMAATFTPIPASLLATRDS
jgi:1-acyl-sn-glycerol-3-phosphate acyltransferase